MKNVKLERAHALAIAIILALSLGACGSKENAVGDEAQSTQTQSPEPQNSEPQSDEPEIQTFELNGVGTFDDVYSALSSYASTTENEVLVEKDESFDKLYGIYPPGSQGTMIYDPYIKMSLTLNEDGSIGHWGIGLPYNKDWVADGTLTAKEALDFGKLIMRGTLPEMSDEQFAQLLTSLQWPSVEEFTEAVVNGVDPGTAGGAIILVGGGEGIYSLALVYSTSNSQFSLIFSNDLAM